MSKELVISSNRHETKVAIMEDDQLVEVYFQRANEYSLAGSVHKGRVTRVLPGMQSAFVDLGLERDTFLYVSDFFEENEDIERIDSPSRPERGERPERGGRGDRPERGGRGDRRDRGDRGDRGEQGERPARVEREPAERLEAVEPTEPVAEPGIEIVPGEAVSEEAAAAAVPSAEAPPPERAQAEEGEGHDRRGGRRSRRRRRGSRGFPESKYASAAERPHESRPDEAPENGPESDAAEVILLPGESLRKYQSPEFESGTSEDAEAAGRRRTLIDQEQEDLPRDLAAIPNDNPEELPPVNAIPDAPLHVGVFQSGTAPALESVPHPEPVEEPVLAELPVEDFEFANAEAGGEDSDAGAEIDEARESGPGGVLEEEEDREIQALILQGEGDTPATGAAEGGQGSIASVREQGGRYMHRMSRRMRRRPRGGPPETSAPAPAPRPEPRTEHRPAPRPERTASPSITDLLKEGQEIIVQIAKEPLGQKGARITSHIALPGRYVVYMPTLDHMGVSRKIASDEERQRLKRILQKHRVGVPGGYIIRTAGEGSTRRRYRAPT